MSFFSELDIERGESGIGGDPLSAYVDVKGSVPAQQTITAQPAATPSASMERPAPAQPEPERKTAPAVSTADKSAGKTEAEPKPAEEDVDAQRKAHEESEAKRKAEFEARQAEKKAAEQAQLDKLAAMSDSELMSASMQRVSADTEKLTRRNMKECVSEYIQTKCLEDAAFARMVMHPRKSMIRCFQYISQKAWEYVQDEMKANGITPGPGQQSYSTDVPDDLCYQWAEDYFRDPDAKIDHEDEEQFVPRPFVGGGGRKRAKSASKEKKPEKKQPEKKAPEKKTPEKPNTDAGQLSILEVA